MRKASRRGSVLVYATVGTFAIAATAALAVDWGRVQVVKAELQAAADAAARFAATGLDNSIYGESAAPANAAAVAAQNKANGQVINFDPNVDVELGKWNANKQTFSVKNSIDKCNAVRVTMRCVSTRGTAVPMSFLTLLGKKSTDVTATSIGVIEYTGNNKGMYDYFVPATSNPWLAGMPKGTIASVNNPHNNPDFAGTPLVDDGDEKKEKKVKPGTGYTTGGSTNAGSAETNYAAWGDYAAKKASPIQAGSISVNGGKTMTFDGVNGGATNAAGQSLNDADGDPNWIASNTAGAENGIANITVPGNSIIGIFLSDDQPNLTTAPASLDFSTAASRNFTTLMPQLKQPFFIGDGRTSTGEVQQFVPPAGATRLFIATMDSYEWSNNVGGFYVTAHASGKVTTVSE